MLSRKEKAVRRRWTFAVMASLVAWGCAPKAARGPATEVAISVNEGGFEPARVTVPKGAPVTLVITRKTDRTCATEAVFSKLGGKTYPLPLNQPVRVELPGGVEDSLGYACAMNMFLGTVVAE